MSDLLVRGLSVHYGGIRAVRAVDLAVRRGQLVAIVGPNGAGKSSTARAIMGLEPAGGSVLISGREVLGRPTHARAGLGVGFVPEGRGVFGPLSVRENLLLGAYGAPVREYAKRMWSVCELFPVLAERLEQHASSLSGGEQQMLAVGRALMSDPAVLICDEPSMGLAPAISKTLFATLRTIADRGAAVLLGDQNAGRVFAVADEVCVMRLGTIIARGAPQTLGSPDELGNHYFGTEAAV